MSFMTFKTWYIDMFVMSSNGLLVCMTAADTINGRRLELSVWLVAVLAINRAHGCFLGDVLVTSYAFGFFGLCRFLAVYMAA
jgi:hypothetical protein